MSFQHSALLLSIALALAPQLSHAAVISLGDVVVTVDVEAEPDQNPYDFPVYARASMGEVEIDRSVALRVSDNCAKWVELENDSLWCSPLGDKHARFAFARATKKQMVSNADAASPVSNPTQIIFLDYDLALVSLKPAQPTKTGKPLYTVVIATPGR